MKYILAAKLFTNGQSQAVRLPKEYRFGGKEVRVKRIGEAVILFPKDREWDMFLRGIAGFSDDFMIEGRADGETMQRKPL